MTIEEYPNGIVQIYCRFTDHVLEYRIDRIVSIK